MGKIRNLWDIDPPKGWASLPCPLAYFRQDPLARRASSQRRKEDRLSPENRPASNPFDADILVQIVPVDTLAATDQSPVLAFFRGPVDKARVPVEGQGAGTTASPNLCLLLTGQAVARTRLTNTPRTFRFSSGVNCRFNNPPVLAINRPSYSGGTVLFDSK
jgi:hypothetical protein